MTIRKGVAVIPMGGMSFGTGNAVLKTTVGSCLAIVMYTSDREYGMAHAVLPQSNGTPSPQFVDSAVELLLQHFHRKGLAGEALEVQFFGGAEMFVTTKGIVGAVGRKNIEAAERIFTTKGLFVRNRETGSYFARKVTIACETGSVRCEKVVADR